ncbi:MAG TPA: alpha/beta hydrolase [Acidimicrobiales bacterium]|jgi:acetyl esterase|nr:alpha/beta hydrolase [Acidimicrobiales bacterium]
MPVDPAIQTMLDQLAEAGGPTLEQAGVEQAREMIRMLAVLEGDPAPLERVEDIEVGGVAARLYATGSGGARPILVWIHGGGWVIGDLETADRTCRKLAIGTDAIVISLDYRLAPEHPFPAGPDDCVAALAWIIDHAAEIGGDRSRIALGGDSAGGNLSAITALHARDNGIPLRFQLLVYPATDLTLSSASIDENGEGYLLTKESMVWFTGHYLTGGTDPKDPRVSPLYTDDLTGVAPALVITAEFDPLRDEGEAYAERLKDAGVPVTLRRFDGQIHGFYPLGSITEGANEAIALSIAALKAALN